MQASWAQIPAPAITSWALWTSESASREGEMPTMSLSAPPGGLSECSVCGGPGNSKPTLSGSNPLFLGGCAEITCKKHRACGFWDTVNSQ